MTPNTVTDDYQFNHRYSRELENLRSSVMAISDLEIRKRILDALADFLASLTNNHER